MNIGSGELELALGGRVGNQSVFLVMDVERGRSEFGLHTEGFHAGIISEWSAGRFRYGFQTRLGAMFIRRATDHDDSLASASFGASTHIAWDLVRSEDGDALFTQLAFRYDVYAPVVYGPSVMLGYRWQSNRRVGGVH
ncbi:MAG TPA: hypothetical protein VG937_24875 [Polyangiaceae bacterium]|nr:hypothetical protein [Polyangiaceae bacterium]